MTQTARTSKDVFQAEVAEARAVFDTETLKSFLYGHAHDTVGTDRVGNPTTLIEEVGELARMAHRAYISDGTNYYRSRGAFASVETDKEESSKRMYVRAGKKLLFLNSVSKSLTGETFIKGRRDKDNVNDMMVIVDAFEFCVRNYAEI